MKNTNLVAIDPFLSKTGMFSVQKFKLDI